MLSKGNVNFDSEKRTKLQNVIIRLRKMGYSGPKVREMLGIPQKKMKTGVYFKNRSMHKYPKTKNDAKKKLQYLLLDMALVHKMRLSDIQDLINLNFNEIKEYQKHGNLKQKNINKVMDLYEEGLSRKEITKKIDLSYVTVCRIIKKEIENEINN